MSDSQNSDRFEKLTDLHRELLRLVFQHHKSAEIAHLLGLSVGYVDNQLAEAKNLLGASSRVVAARWFAAYESRGGFSSHEFSAPSPPTVCPLPLPVPTSKVPANTMRWQHVALWGGLIAIGAPVALAVAVMLLVSLHLLVGMRAM